MTDIPFNPSLAVQELEEKLDKFILQYHAVKQENSSLKSQQVILVEEKAQLLDKTALARTRVEAMITRLKAMEHSS